MRSARPVHGIVCARVRRLVSREEATQWMIARMMELRARPSRFYKKRCMTYREIATELGVTPEIARYYLSQRDYRLSYHKMKHVSRGPWEPRRKLTAEQVIAIRTMGGSAGETARKYNVCRSTVSQIRARDTWKHI